MLDEAKEGMAENKRTWFTVWSPYLDKAFFIIAQPGGTIPMPEIEGNTTLEVTLTLALDEYKGLMTAVEPTDTD